MRILILMAAAAAVLGACATATPYQQASANAPYGFQEQTIESNRVRINFRGNTLTDRATVETYLLYRAAEVTLERGFDYFIVANRNTDEDTRLQPTGPHLRPRFGFDYWYFSPRRGWSPWYDPFWAEPSSYREVTRYEAVAEIAMFHGAKPQNDANAFDAREVQTNLQGQIVRPPPPG
ncbi:MAG: hypothetical protein JNK94_06675 [Hyphomonadaceae bacterium]|nr:hypothetical protein [Hyphomonadaceae bacterium]MBX3509668.1 hypothetical protein [Hyphomonadaceae bacterium]